MHDTWRLRIARAKGKTGKQEGGGKTGKEKLLIWAERGEKRGGAGGGRLRTTEGSCPNEGRRQ